MTLARLLLAGFATCTVAWAPPAVAQTQLELNLRAAATAQQADDALNKAYRKLLPLLDAEARQKLVTAQLAWIRFRDAECAFAADEYRGGSAAPSAYSDCVIRMSRQRTGEFAALIKKYSPL